MNLFLSHTSSDRDKLQPLLDGVHRLKHSVWYDQELMGGQDWWDAILAQIRQADALLLAVSPAVIGSEACLREVDYARAVGKPILPVMIETVLPEFLPTDIATVQIVDFSTPDGNAAFALAGALQLLPPAKPMPDQLPDPPPVPVSYLAELSQQILGPNHILPTEQLLLVPKLKLALAKPRERDAAVQLIEAFKQRDDLLASVGKDLAAIPIPPPEDQGGGTETHFASGFYPDPMRRHQERFFDGNAWTPRVRDLGVETLESPTSPSRPAQPAKPSGTMTWLVVGGVIGGVVVVVAILLLLLSNPFNPSPTGSVTSPSPTPLSTQVDIKKLILPPQRVTTADYTLIANEATSEYGWNGWQYRYSSSSSTSEYYYITFAVFQLPGSGDRVAELKQAQCDMTFTNNTPTSTNSSQGPAGSGVAVCEYTFGNAPSWYEYQVIHNGVLIEVAMELRNADFNTATQEADQLILTEENYIDANK